MSDILKVKFTTVIPEEMTMMDDDRSFLFVKGGQVYAGYHLIQNLFKEEDGNVIDAEAWVQWMEE